MQCSGGGWLQSAEYDAGVWTPKSPTCKSGFHKIIHKLNEGHPVYKKGLVTVAFACKSHPTSTSGYYVLYDVGVESWRPELGCPMHFRVCGFQTRADDGLNVSPVGLIELRVTCCPGEWHLGNICYLER